MAEKKKEYETFVTPRGVANWPHLNGPDTKYKAEGEYHTKLIFDPSKPEDAAFLAMIQEREDAYLESVREENPKKAKTLKPWNVIKDELDDEGDETGRKVLRFKMGAQYVKDGVTKKREPRFFDAKNQKILLSDLPKLSGGSILKIQFSIVGNHTPKNEAGITLYLSNVQVIKAVEYSGGGSAFKDEGDGFVGGSNEENSFQSESSSTEETPTNGDF